MSTPETEKEVPEADLEPPREEAMEVAEATNSSNDPSDEAKIETPEKENEATKEEPMETEDASATIGKVEPKDEIKEEKLIAEMKEVVANLELGEDSSDEDASETDIIPSKKAPRGKVIVDWNCLNPVCNVSSKSKLQTARKFACDFFAVPQDAKKKRKICEDCLDFAEATSDAMAKKLLKQEPCFPSEQFPLPKSLVTLDDSDEEFVDNSSSESEYEFETDKFEELVSKVMKEKFKIEDQIDEAIKSVDKRLKDVEPAMDETEKIFDDLEKNIDALRNSLYRPFKPKLNEIEPIDLNQTNDLTKSRTLIGSVQTAPIFPSGALPPSGNVDRPDVVIGQTLYAMRGNILRPWKLGTVVQKDVDGKDFIKVRKCFKFQSPLL